MVVLQHQIWTGSETVPAVSRTSALCLWQLAEPLDESDRRRTCLTLTIAFLDALMMVKILYFAATMVLTVYCARPAPFLLTEQSNDSSRASYRRQRTTCVAEPSQTQESAALLPSLSPSQADSGQGSPESEHSSNNQNCSDAAALGTGTSHDAAESQAECICCLDRPASMVASRCGHLVACNDCRRRLVYKALYERGTYGLPKMRCLPQDMIKEMFIDCPVCRLKGTLLERSRFAGTMYVP